MRMTMRRFVLTWLPVVLFAAGIFAVSAQADIGTGPGHWKDKFVHMLEYAPFGFLVMRAMSATCRRTGCAALGSFGIASVYGASDEFHQSFVPGRSADWRDWVADSLGIMLGITVFWIAVRRQ